MSWARGKDLRSRDSTRLAGFQFAGEGSRGDLLLVHGYADHMGRYSHVARALAEAGWRVHGVDLRGHGESDGRRGHVADWAEYLDDVSAAADTLTNPVLVAHSMGGLVTLDWMRRHPGQARAAVISAPLLRPAVKAPRWKTGAARVLSRLIPALTMANEIPPSDVSRHPEIIEKYRTDPLVFTTATPRWYTEMLAASARVRSARFTTPLLCMWGDADKIVAPEAIADFTKTWAGPIETKVWPGLYHEIFNEPERDEVLGVVTRWLAAL